MGSPTTSPAAGPSGSGGPLLGSQVPRVLVVPEYVRTYGDEVNDFMSQVGRPMDGWQSSYNTVAFAVQAGGLWAAFELLLFLARQNGKGVSAEALKLAGLFLFREPLIIYSAHQLKTTLKAFKRLLQIVEGSDWLTRRVKKVNRGPLTYGVELTAAAGGGELEYVARSSGSGRGYTGSSNIFDEALLLTIAQYQAMTPTLSTLPNPRIVFLSSPPDEETGPMPADAMLPSVRRRAHAGEPRMALMEWSPPPGYDIDDPQVWAQCNPSMNLVRQDGSTGVSQWFLAKQLAAFREAGKPQKFATEHLGEWPPDANEQWQVIPEADWGAACDTSSRRAGTVAFAVEMSLDRRWVCIAMGGVRQDGLRHTEVVDSRPGPGWVVARVKELRDRHRPCAVVVRPDGPAGSLIAGLEAAGVELVKMSSRDAMQACGAFFDGISGAAEPDRPSPRTIRHIGQGVLTTAVAGAARKVVGNAWLWDQRSPQVDVSPLVAATNALWGHATYARRAVVLTGPLMA
ncbi:MAG TPA: hypothetical protein VFM54_23395 [Micromonosporaceae bacterium]|nr:hypothetical protein [Micromonosporaceae bacterium]